MQSATTSHVENSFSRLWYGVPPVPWTCCNCLNAVNLAGETVVIAHWLNKSRKSLTLRHIRLTETPEHILNEPSVLQEDRPASLLKSSCFRWQMATALVGSKGSRLEALRGAGLATPMTIKVDYVEATLFQQYLVVGERGKCDSKSKCAALKYRARQKLCVCPRGCVHLRRPVFYSLVIALLSLDACTSDSLVFSTMSCIALSCHGFRQPFT